ncbi:MAG: DUF951 domain-containing protein [Pleurocapsa minor GSE-CHR-MK-17-07R]|jgi:hypothetical protein|nr:DUF951 domain-containing protein [Pleurocapsa minor GSE-CHR-MK 17-07R]
MPAAPRTVNTGDEVEMRKAHPCGSTRWKVFRTGADIGLQCLGCGKRMLMPRGEFNKHARQITPISETERGTS